MASRRSMVSRRSTSATSPASIATAASIITAGSTADPDQLDELDPLIRHHRPSPCEPRIAVKPPEKDVAGDSRL
jgi:hypothetical protein